MQWPQAETGTSDLAENSDSANSSDCTGVKPTRDQTSMCEVLEGAAVGHPGHLMVLA